MKLSLLVQYDADDDIGRISLLRTTDAGLIRIVAQAAAVEADRATAALRPVDEVAAFSAASDGERARVCLQLLGTTT